MTDPIRSRPTPWKNVVLLCGKCSKKLDGGFGPKRKETLRSVLRAALKADNRRREVRIVETRCMGLCPKNAITALNATNPGSLLTIPEGAGIEQVLMQLVGPGKVVEPSGIEPLTS
jgi:predicted metal-binding protein